MPGTEVYATQSDISSAMTNVVTSNATLDSITIGPATLQAEVTVGESEQLTARGAYSDSTFFDIATEVNWASSDPAVVTVSNITGEKGQITGVMSGFAEVTATDPRTLVTDTISVVVLQ